MHSGGIQLFDLRGDRLHLTKKWTCEDAGIYEVKLDASKNRVYGVDTKSRVWVVNLEGELCATSSSFMVADPSTSSAIQGTGVSVGGGTVSAVSMSGDLVVSDLSLRKIWSVKAHDAEALCVQHFDGENLIATGSEDMKVKWWDVRTGSCELELARRHEAGVTCVASAGEQVCLTGSYDDHLRVFDLRQPQRALLEQRTDGGVWDVVWHPAGLRKGKAGKDEAGKAGEDLVTEDRTEALFLMPNCYAGLQVGRYNGNSIRLESVSTPELCYAAGWFDQSIVYTFFYDQQLRHLAWPP